MVNYELNSKNLALLGLLDECRQLYSNIEDIYVAEFEHTIWLQCREGKLSEEERHLLLVALLKDNKMTRFQIMRDIENAIRIFDDDYRFINAVSKWKSDLLFISEYSISHI